jgi:hypothetical protein
LIIHHQSFVFIATRHQVLGNEQGDMALPTPEFPISTKAGGPRLADAYRDLGF